MKRFLNRAVAVVLMVSLAGCSLAGPGTYGRIEDVSDEEIGDVVERVIDEHWDTIGEAMDEHGTSMRAFGDDISPEMVVEEAFKEEKGREQVEFCYAVATGADVDTVLGQAEKLLTEEQYADLLLQVEDNREGIYRAAQRAVFDINDENREDFYDDLQKLVVSTTVLLTASIVYSLMPHVFYWGKITALAAISVSAGAVAATIMSIYSWYQTDKDEFDAFKDWLNMVTEEPHAAYLTVCSVISLGHSMKFSPICTSAILGIFAIYNVLSIVRDMLESYGEED